MLEIASSVTCFDGQQIQYKHKSEVLGCEMQFSVFLPPQSEHEAVPVVYWLSGLTCNDQNFVTKAGAQQYASDLGIAIVCPDTSPRGDGVPDDPEAAYDFGLGAGFYVNATQEPWSQHYRMYDYIVHELPSLLKEVDGLDTGRASISGHSMGGHGALSIGLKNPDKYRSVSAFSPIVAPTHCPWGQKALGNYIGADKTAWADYDSCELVAKASQQRPTLVDQGTSDNFLEEQLKTELLVQACEKANYPMTIRMQEGYDHSYFFIATFIQSHLEFHSQHLS
ncbi:MAG: S-formylglutathione hydrolase [Arenicella sp.]|jgi:S-formylglutathione hydrolase|nr:S-formylglutathione hydrolase [Arenicella sp.]